MFMLNLNQINYVVLLLCACTFVYRYYIILNLKLTIYNVFFCVIA